MKKYIYIFFILIFPYNSFAQQSIARQWNEVMLDAIREDLARPPVQARNLYHVCLAMYDAWAAYDQVASTYLLGKTVGGIYYPYTGVAMPSAANLDEYRKKAISYAAYRVLVNRYSGSPNGSTSLIRFTNLMSALGYSTSYTSTNYSNNDPRDLGNYIGQKVIEMGMADGARQANNYAPANYATVNPALDMQTSGNTSMTNVNRWQRLFIVTAFDQSGNPIPSLQNFVCPEWGKVLPFAMSPGSAVIYNRDGGTYPVYHDPGMPPLLNVNSASDQGSIDYKWGYTMNITWSSHLTPNDGVNIDISPNAMGNVTSYPTTIAGQKTFYNFYNGGDIGTGYTVNPVTGLPYTPQIVKRGDYTRVVSQYWADGPNSETPPGHWFTLLNSVSDNPLTVKKYEGVGPVLSNLEWDIKTYLTLSGAMHDAAIACWGIKGWYDSPRPVSTIRKMAEYGQCTDMAEPSYNPAGLPLIPGYIEIIKAGDPLAGASNENVNKIKVKSWRGFSYIANPYSDIGDVGWILAANWLPYQRSTFVTPPFAGYVSGHSTYSRAGATVLTKVTGSPYFPGGMGEYTIQANTQYLQFENGPTTDIKLQWATYKDASDQASLSRIYGGIHPPFDDMPGRAIGEQIGNEAHNIAKSYFSSVALPVSLLSFTTQEKDCSMQINWTTGSEINAKTFAILRSEDGINFNTKIAEVNAQGSASASKNYQVVDYAPFVYNYYKLVETSIDGSTKEYPIVISKLTKCDTQNDKIAAIAPNPIFDIAKLSIQNLTKNQYVTIDITDITGKIVNTRKEKLNAGFNSIELRLQNLVKGTYFVRTKLQNGFEDVQKVIKL